jgi:hypothetical protein
VADEYYRGSQGVEASANTSGVGVKISEGARVFSVTRQVQGDRFDAKGGEPRLDPLPAPGAMPRPVHQYDGGPAVGYLS